MLVLCVHAQLLTLNPNPSGNLRRFPRRKAPAVSATPRRDVAPCRAGRIVGAHAGSHDKNRLATQVIASK